MPSSCANSKMPHAECEIDNRIGVEVTQRDRARQGRTGQRRVDLGDLDRALGPPPDAIESHGHVRRIAELRFVGGVIRQRSQARAAGAHVRVETERIGAAKRGEPKKLSPASVIARNAPAKLNSTKAADSQRSAAFLTSVD